MRLSNCKKCQFYMNKSNKNNIINIDTNILSDDASNSIYRLVFTNIFINNVENITYGVCVVQNGNMIDYMLGISNDYEQAVSFVNLCNSESLELVHFRDVVEDFFSVR